jgi:predicted nucleic-acid-binding protein
MPSNVPGAIGWTCRGSASAPFVRHQNDEVQSPKATELFERRLTEADPGFVSVVAMTEAAWVLERAYGVTDAAIAAAIERMLQTEVRVVEREQAVFTAMMALTKGD